MAVQVRLADVFRNRRRRGAVRAGFTLVELLVVISIIALLLTILMPTFKSVRAQAKRTVCGTHLRQIGVALQGYLGTNRDRFPVASFFPSVGSMPLDGPEPVYIADVLGSHVSRDDDVFHCPADIAGRIEREPPHVGKSYFQTERSSYEYRSMFGGQTIDEIAGRIEQRMAGRSRDESHEPVPVQTIWIFRDWYNFHGPGGKPGSRNYLYVDGHVSDFEKF